MNLAEQTRMIFNILGQGFPLNRLGILLEHKDLILQWLNSKEFQDIYKNHPFPPLLNPNEINYMATDPQVAWDFNIPLPPTYQMLISILPGAGGSAFYKFLSLCGVDCYSKFYGHALAYLENYKIFCESQKFKALIVTDFTSNATYKFWNLINKPMLMLHLIRDPILVLRHLINHVRPIEQKPLAKRFNLTCDYIMPEIAYHCSNEKPNLDGVIRDCINGLYRSLFIFAQKLAAIKPTEVIYIDTKEISGENAFNTFCNLSKRFGFNKPKNEHKSIFSSRINKNISLVTALPITLYAHIDDINKKSQDLSTLQEGYAVAGGGANISIIAPYDFKENEVNLTNELMLSLENIILSANAKDALILRQNPKLKSAAQKYLKGYFKRFHEKEAEIKKNLIKVEQVLEYFKTHREQREAIKAILDMELAHIKQHRPDIVNTWEYYLEFEKICKNGA